MHRVLIGKRLQERGLVAVDANGTAHWFKSPDVAPFTTFWFADEEPAPLFDYVGDWRESLTTRPD